MPQPIGIEAYADSVEYIDQVFFDSGIDDQWVPEKAAWQDGEVQITGDQNWGSFLMHLVERKPNYGASTRFKFKNGATFSLTIQHGTWNTDDYREIGFTFLGDTPLPVLTFGKAALQEKPLQGSLHLLPEKWYQASYFVDKDGTFLVTVWQEDNVNNNGYFIFTLDEADRQTEWRFVAMANEEVIYIDSVEFFDFASLRDPETVTLTQPTAPQAAPTKEIAAAPPTPTSTPVPISFSEGAEKGLVEEIKRFGVGSVYASEYSPDGNMIAFGTSFGVYFFDPAKIKLLDFLPSSSEVKSVAFNFDGEWLAYGTDYGEIIIWDIKNKEELTKFKEHEISVNTLAFSPDNQYLVSSGEDSKVKVWLTDDWSLQRAHDIEYVNSLIFTPDSSMLFVGTQGRVVTMDSRGWGILNLYDRADFGEGTVYFSTATSINAIALSPNGKFLAVGLENAKAVPVLELPSGKTHLLAPIDPHPEEFRTNNTAGFAFGVNVYSVSFSSDGEYLAFAGRDRIGLVDLARGGSLVQFSPETGSNVRFSPKGDRLVLGWRIKDLTSWGDKNPFFNSSDFKNEVIASANPNDGTYVFEEYNPFPSGDWEIKINQEEGTVSLKESGASQPLYSVIGHTPQPFNFMGLMIGYSAGIVVKAAPDESFFVTGGVDKLVKLWQVAEEPSPLELGKLRDEVKTLDVSGDNSLVAAGDKSGYIMVCPISDEPVSTTVGPLDTEITAMVLSPEGDLLAAGDMGGHIIVWNLAGESPEILFEAEQTRQHESQSANISYLEFSPDGKVLLSGGGSTHINIWRSSDGSLLQTLENLKPVRRMQFSADGAVLYTDGSSFVRWWGVKQ